LTYKNKSNEKKLVNCQMSMRPYPSTIQQQKEKKICQV